MKAYKLVKILQSVEPETDVFFHVGYDKEERKDILDMVNDNPDILSELVATSVEICEMSRSKLRVDVSLLPDGFYTRPKNQ